MRRLKYGGELATFFTPACQATPSVCEEFAAPHPTPREIRFAFLPQAFDHGSLHFREFADLAHVLLKVRPVGDFGTVLSGRQNNQFCQRCYEVVGQGGGRSHALRDRLSSGRTSSLCTQFTEPWLCSTGATGGFSLDRCFEIGLDWRAAKQGINNTTNKTEMMWR